MPVTNLDTAQAKRNRLPFKPPRRQAEGASSSAANKTAKKQTTAARKRKASPAEEARASKPKAMQKKAASKTESKKSREIVVTSDSEASSEDDNQSDNNHDGTTLSSQDTSSIEEPEYILAEIVTNERPRDIQSGEPGIPSKLLTRLLHHHFQNPKTKIAKDANEVVAKYVDIFVREALARAAYERAQSNSEGGARSRVDGFLEVEDLEKLAPQMLLDF